MRPAYAKASAKLIESYLSGVEAGRNSSVNEMLQDIDAKKATQDIVKAAMDGKTRHDRGAFGFNTARRALSSPNALKKISAIGFMCTAGVFSGVLSAVLKDDIEPDAARTAADEHHQVFTAGAQTWHNCAMGHSNDMVTVDRITNRLSVNGKPCGFAAREEERENERPAASLL